MINNYISNHTNSIFEQPWWLDIVAPDLWSEIIIEEDRKVIARWPIVKIGSRVTMPKLTQTLGFWISEEKIRNDKYLNERKKIIKSLLEKLPKNKSISIMLDPSVDYFLPMYWRNYVIRPLISYRIQDLRDINEVFNCFKSNTKGDIKRASKKLKVESIDDVEILLMLISKTFSLQNRKNPFPISVIKQLYSTARKYNSCKLLYAKDDNGIIHAGSLFVHDENVCYYLLSGSDPEYRGSAASSLLIWEGIKYAATCSKTFDFEGSMIEGVENFFRQFGGTPIVYYQIRKQNIMFEFFELIKPWIKKILGYKR